LHWNKRSGFGQCAAILTTTDYVTRVVSIAGPKGNVLTSQVARQAQGLESVRVGDQVTFEYSEAVQFSVVSP